MEILMAIGIPTLIVACIIGVIIGLFAAGYVKSPPDQAYIISGPFKHRELIGKAGFKIPFFERLDKLDLSLIPIDVKTADEVPTADYINIKVDAVVNVKIGKDKEMLEKATTNFLNADTDTIAAIAREVLEGNMREIIGQMHLEQMVSERQKFVELVMENAHPDLAKMGLEIVSFNVQNFFDKNGVIENLGVDNVVRIQKNAAISRAESERDIAIEKAKAAKAANDAQIEAQEQIAEKNAQLERRQAALKKDVDTQKAQAAAANAIEAEKQRQLKEVAETNANIARAEREAELKQKEIELKEYELDALVRKQADADKYAAEKEAEAELIRRQKDAEAAAYEIEMRARAQKAEAEAERYAAEQKAAGIAAVGVAEAEAIDKKAEAQKKMGEASVLEMYFNVLPQIVANASAPLTGVDKITMYGDGNTTKLVGDVMNSTNQIMEAIKGATGIDLSSALGGFIGAKSSENE